MEELVGTCSRCGKEIYCQNGFLDGVVREDKTLVCFDCDQKKETLPADT